MKQIISRQHRLWDIETFADKNRIGIGNTSVLLRYSDTILWSLVVIVQACVEGLAGFMNTITEIVASFGLVATLTLLPAIS